MLFEWLNNQLLKMQWLYDLVKVVVEKVFGLSADERIGGSIHFFIYDTFKIFILLSILIYLISWIQSFFPPERTRKLLGGIKGLKGNTLGALLGTLTPFCSCSSIPIFIGFTSARLPLGVTFSFLISSPLVDLASFLILTSFFGLKLAVAYVLTGLIIAVTGGTIIGSLKMEKYIEGYVMDIKETEGEIPQLDKKERRTYAFNQVKDIIKRVWKYIIIGVGIGALIHNWIPREAIEVILGKESPLAVILAALVGIPMYADIFGTIPIAEALLSKGVGLGTVLSFMMAVTALSLPSLIMLSKVVKQRLLVTFVAIVSAGIIITGYIFNFFAWLL